MTKKQPMKSEAKEFRKFIYEQYETVKGRPYNASFAKDSMLCSLLCGRFPLYWLKGLWDFYLQWDDPFVKNCGYTIGVFYSKINQMLEMEIHKSRWTERHKQRKGLSKIQKQDLINCL